MTAGARAYAALGTLAVIIAITASWWALALWPMSDTPPEWLVLTRQVCFGTSETGLPDAGGWLVLMGQPLSMLLVLFAGWGRDVRAGIALVSQRVFGQLALGSVAALLVVAAGGVLLRVRVADARSFATSNTEQIAGQLNRINDTPKPLDLVDQSGKRISLEQFKGRPVIVTFAFAHCSTICPLIVSDVLSARDKLTLQKPVVLIVTLDPWRDTPSRLKTIADQWGVTGDAHVLSGSVEEVELTLTRWRVPRIRNEQTGDLSHPTLVYVIGQDGKIAYVLNGTQSIIRAAVEAL
jgi:cytochrome oxidase Cu insertion factor (SCO1/SenC/PrrC family)